MSNNSKKKSKKAGAGQGGAAAPSIGELKDIRDAAFDFVMNFDIGATESAAGESTATSEEEAPKASAKPAEKKKPKQN